MAGKLERRFNFTCKQTNAKIVFSTAQLAKDRNGCREMDMHTLMLVGIALLEDSLLTFLKSILKSICL